MERMSISSESSNRTSSLNSRHRDDFVELYRHFKNTDPEAEFDPEAAEQTSKKKIKALRTLGWTFEQLVKFIDYKVKEKPKEKMFANKQLWAKLNQKSEKIPPGVSKSKLVDSTVEYIRNFIKKRNIVPEVVNLDDDDDDEPAIINSGGGDCGGYEVQMNQLHENLYNLLKEKVSLFLSNQNGRIPDVEAIKKPLSNLLEIITEKAGFTGSTLMTLYACDLRNQQERDPRRGTASKPSRLKEVFKIYFKAQELLLPAWCHLDLLADHLVEFCRRNHQFVGILREVAPDEMDKFKQAVARIDQQAALSVSAASTSATQQQMRQFQPQQRSVYASPARSDSVYKNRPESNQQGLELPRPVPTTTSRMPSESETSISPEHSKANNRYEYREVRRVKEEPRRDSSREYSRHDSREYHEVRRIKDEPRESSSRHDYRESSSRRDSREYSRHDSRNERESSRHRDYRRERRNSEESRTSDHYRRESSSRRDSREYSRHDSRSEQAFSRDSRYQDREHRRERRNSNESRTSNRSDSRRPRSRSPSRRTTDRSKPLDSKALGFGNTRNLSQENLKFFVDTREKFTNMMDGVIGFCEVEKLEHDMFSETNTNKIVLDFMIFMDRNKKTLRDIKDNAQDKAKLSKMANDIFGNKNKTSSDFIIYRSLFEKAAYYATHKYEPAELNDPYANVTSEEVQIKLELFLDQLYAAYNKHRKCPKEYIELHEAIYFSRHLRKSSFLQGDMDDVANDFIDFLVRKNIPLDGLKDNGMATIKKGELPSSCSELHSAISRTVHEHFYYLANTVPFSEVVKGKNFNKADGNGLFGLIEYIGKCILQEISLMIENKEIENLAFEDVDVGLLQNAMNAFSDQLIENNFTMYEAINSFYLGQLSHLLEGVKNIEGLIDNDFAVSFITFYICSIVKRRQIVGPPLGLRMKDMLQKKAYVFLKSYTIVTKEVSEKAQFNKLFPNYVEEQAVKIIQDKLKDDINQIDEEVLNFLSMDEKPSLETLKEEQRVGEEPFIDNPGKVILLGDVTIAAKGRAKVTAGLCGVPRIKFLSQMDVWIEEDLSENQKCQIIVEDHRLVRDNRLLLQIINTTDEEVKLASLTHIGYAKVHEVSESTLCEKDEEPTMILKFLRHYFQTCQMTNIEETEDEGLSFGNSHEIKLRKQARVNFRVTYSNILKPPFGDLYTVDAVVFFLMNFQENWEQYLRCALAARVPIIAHRDHFNLINYMRGKTQRCFQIRSTPKLKEMNIVEDIDETIDSKDDEKMTTDIVQKYNNNGYPVEELINGVKDQCNIPLEMAKKRIEFFFILIEKMQYNLRQMAWDTLKSGRCRDLFEKAMSNEFATFYQENPDTFNECDILRRSSCLAEIKQLKNIDQCRVACAFLGLVRHRQEEVKKSRKTLERIIAKNDVEMIETVDLNNETELIKKLIEENSCKENAKYEKLTVYVAANAFVLAFILIAPDGDDPSSGDIIKVGSRLLASCEKHYLSLKKTAKAVTFAVEECQEQIKKADLTIFVDDSSVQTIFDYKHHCQYEPTLDLIKHEFITIPDGANPAGYLLLTRCNKAKKPSDDKYEMLYALKDTFTSVMSVMYTKKKKESKMEYLKKKEEEAATVAENDEPEVMELDGAKSEKYSIKKKKEGFTKKVYKAWVNSQDLIPFHPLITFMTDKFREEAGCDDIEAKCKANDLAIRLVDANIEYDKLSKCNTDDLKAFMKKARMPKDVSSEELISMILESFKSQTTKKEPVDEPMTDAAQETEEEGEVR